MIEFTHVSKDFGSGEKMVRAVRDVSLTIQDGEIFGIIGFSGAGKSTLVRCINLLERPTNGTVVVDGKEMTALSPKELRLARRKIGMIFQHEGDGSRPDHHEQGVTDGLKKGGHPVHDVWDELSE